MNFCINLVAICRQVLQVTYHSVSSPWRGQLSRLSHAGLRNFPMCRPSGRDQNRERRFPWEHSCRIRGCDGGERDFRRFVDCDARLFVWLFNDIFSNSYLCGVEWLDGSKYWIENDLEVVVAPFKAMSRNLSRLTEEKYENLNLLAESRTWLLPKASRKCYRLCQPAW